MVCTAARPGDVTLSSCAGEHDQQDQDNQASNGASESTSAESSSTSGDDDDEVQVGLHDQLAVVYSAVISDDHQQ